MYKAILDNKILIIYLVCYFLFELIRTIHALNSLNAPPLKAHLRKLRTKQSFFSYLAFPNSRQNVIRRYHAYTYLTTDQLKVIQIYLKGKDSDKGVIYPFIDILIKSVFPLLVFFIGLVLTATLNGINLLTNNNPAPANSTVLMGIILAIAAFINLIWYRLRKKSIKNNIHIIEQVLKDREKGGSSPLFAKGQILRSSADFENAMFFAVPVSVWQNNEMTGYGGTIDRHMSDAVFINGEYFAKSGFEFRIRGYKR